jgi:hypothetical protein
MKFDIVVGNPPYQDNNNKAKNNKLWHKFAKKTLTLVTDIGFVAFVTPASIFDYTVGMGKWFKDRLNNQLTLTHASVHKEKQWFSVGVNTCHWVVTRSSKHKKVMLPILRDPMIDSIVSKMLDSAEFLSLIYENPQITKENLNIGDCEIYYSGKNKTNTDLKPNNVGLKIVYPFSASYSSQFITDSPTCKFNKILPITNIKEGNNILSYTNSNLYRFYADNHLKTAGFTPVVKNNNLLPKLDSDRMWTNNDVYKHFLLSDDEINFIESRVKKVDK